MTDDVNGGLDSGLDIAVISMAGRFPGAPDLERFWEMLRDGREGISFYSEEEILARGADPARVAIASFVRAGAQLPDVDLFDAGFFGFSPREAEQMDPQQRFFLECAWEVLERAGYDPERYPGLIGVYAGSGTNEYLLFHLLRHLTDLSNVLQLTIGNEKDFLATRVSYELDLKGPSINVQTGCSSALVAVHLACQSLLGYQCDMALAGGISLQMPDAPGYLFEPGGILSPDGHCRAFSAEAQGAVAASGVGIVVLKRLADALADGDTIHAVIKGSALNNDGASKIGYTAPSIEGQARVIDMAQAAAAVDPRSITFVEGHGSGTPLGDPIEMAALTRAFRAGTADRGFCALGSVKTNIGHCDTAAGVAGLIKTVLALKHRQIPPTLHFERPNPQLDLESSPFYVNARLIDWPAGSTPRRAGVSSFGIGGTNAHVIVEEAPLQTPADSSSADRAWDLLVLSARSEEALERATDNLAEHLERHPGASLSDVAWTLQAGRRRFAWRRTLACPGGDVSEAARALRERDPRRLLSASEEAVDRPVAFLFPGLGDHYPGMAAGLYRDEPVFRREIDRCADVLAPLLGLDLRQVLFPTTEAEEPAGIDLRAMLGRRDPLAGSPLVRTAVAQPATFAVEYALARLWESWGIRPAAMLGYSLGEYVAAAMAGVFTPEDALRVVAERARLIEELPAGAMLAVPLPEAETTELLGRRLSIAALNGPGVTVVAGPPEEVEGLARILEGRGLAARPLPTTHAFHSWMMEPVAGAVRELLASVRLHAPSLPYVSDVTGGWITAAETTDPEYWVAHLLRPVRFAAGLAEVWREPATALLEVGPGQSLGSLAVQHTADRNRVVVPSLRGSWEKQPDGAFLLAALGKLWLAGRRVDWAGFHAGERRRRIPLPTYPFERKSYWVGGARRSGPAPVPLWAVADQPAPAAEPALAAAPAARHTRPTLRNAFVPPGTELERALASLWERLLGIEGIGLHDNFFELGGHSLLGTQLVNLAREVLGADLPLEALFATPTVAGMAAAVAAARTGSAGQAPQLVPVGRSERKGDLPLSFAQSRMWFLHQLAPGSPVYNIPFAVRLAGALDPAALTAAVREVVRRHEALRTTFHDVGGRPAQAIAPPEAAVSQVVPVIDLGALPAGAREAELRRLGAESAGLPFDLARGPLLRLGLVRLEGRDHALLLNMHHIISDGWSMGVFVGELAALYEDLRSGRPPSLPALPIQYADFADWQSRWLSGEVLERHLAWWRGRLEGKPATTELPFDRPRSEAGAALRAVAGKRRLVVPAGLTSALRALAEREGVTPYIVLLAAFDAVLARYGRQDDISVGTPTANRTRAEVAGLIGFFVNTLVLRVDLAGDPTFRELVGRAGEAALGAFAHQDLPFEKLVEELHPERALTVTPLFQVMFSYQNAPLPRIELPGLTLSGVESDTATAMFDLTLTTGEIGAGPDAGGLRLTLEYASALFEAATAERMLGHFAHLLAAAVAEPGRRLSALPLCSEAELFQLLAEWNDTEADAPDVLLAHQLVAARAAADPEALAVAGGGERLSYGELDARAGRLACHLRELGIGREAAVTVCLERSPALLVAMLAVLKTGGAYLPLDPAYPPERLAGILAEAAAPLVLTREGLRDRLPVEVSGARVLALDSLDLPPSPGGSGVRMGEGGQGGDGLAYVIYTSGSTGVPKGIEVTHGSLRNLITWHHGVYGIRPGDRAALIAGPGFDASVMEIWPLLAAGASIHVPDDETRIAPRRLLDWLVRERITLCFLPTPLAELVLREEMPAGLALRALFTGGDKLMRGPRPGLPFPVYDHYGPAECTVVTTWTPAPPDPAAPSIGRPIRNDRVYLLDRDLAPVPLGAPGELFCGGGGLARGYRRRPDLTAERFVPDPFAPGGRLYRTGDLARFRPDGMLEFLGRLDDQIKVRGFRLELGEVEAAITRHPGVAACAVVARRDDRGDVRLAAYVVPEAALEEPPIQLTGSDLRRALRARLPEHMVPAVVVLLDALPLTPNGKIDRRALPEPPAAQAAGAGGHVPPRTAVEEELARIWAGLLALPFDRVGVNDNFFDLGGHSLLATQCVAQVRERLGAEIQLQSLFGNATLGEIADAIVEAELRQVDQDSLREILADFQGLDEEALQALLAGEEPR